MSSITKCAEEPLFVVVFQNYLSYPDNAYSVLS
jgi:hypothetical protein